MIRIPSFLTNFFNAFVRAWSFARNWVVSHHIPFVLLFAYSCLRIAVSTVTTVFNAIYTSATVSQSLITDSQSSGSAISTLTYFGVVNSFFPVPETFAFLAAVLGLRSSLWVYTIYRTIYKNIPLKST